MKAALRGLFGAAAVIAVGALFFLQCFDIDMPLTGDPLGPRAFPMALAVILLALGVLDAVQAIGTRSDTTGQSAPVESPPLNRGTWIVVVATVFIVVYSAGIFIIGYALATALMAAAAYMVFGRKRIIPAVFSGAAFAACFWLVFHLGLASDLPVGLVWDHL